MGLTFTVRLLEVVLSMDERLGGFDLHCSPIGDVLDSVRELLCLLDEVHVLHSVGAYWGYG